MSMNPSTSKHPRSFSCGRTPAWDVRRTPPRPRCPENSLSRPSNASICCPQRAGDDHERREDTQKSPFACLLSQFWIRSRRISGPIRRPAAPRPAETAVFPWHLISNAVVQIFRCSVFLRLLTRAMEQHVDTHRFTMQVAAGSSRMNG